MGQRVKAKYVANEPYNLHFMVLHKHLKPLRQFIMSAKSLQRIDSMTQNLITIGEF